MKLSSLYLDKKAGAINALKDYAKMELILKTGGPQIHEAEERLARLKAQSPEAKDRISRVQETVDLMRTTYEEAEEYMAWFQPAWDALSEDDRFVLESFYIEGGEAGDMAAIQLADHFHIERASVYRRKNRALDNLTTLLYGRF